MSARTRSILALVVAALAAPASLARADDDASVAAKRVVGVVVVGSPEDATAIERSLRELLQRLGLEMRSTRADRVPSGAERGAPAADVAVRVWIDLQADDIARVEIADARGARAVKRDVAREGTRSVLLEDVAHVVQAAVESIMVSAPAEKQDAGAPPAAPAPPAPPTPQRRVEDAGGPPSAPATWSFDVASFASLTPFAHDTSVVVGAGAGVRVGFGGDAWRPALWISGAYHASFGHDGMPLDLRASVWSLRLVPALMLFDAGRFSFDGGVGGGADVFVISPGARAPGATLDAVRTEASPILTGMFVVRFAITSSATAFFAGTLDVDLKPRRYVAKMGDATTKLVDPLAVRPSIALGLSFDLVGSRSAPGRAQ